MRLASLLRVTLAGVLLTAATTPRNVGAQDPAIPTELPFEHFHVLKFILDDNFDVVPDDAYFRTYIMSVHRGLVVQCGSGEFGDNLVAQNYGTASMRNLVQNPGWEALFAKILLAGFEYNSTGIEDGQEFGAAFGCANESTRLLRTRIVELMSSRQGEPTEQFSQERYERLLSPAVSRRKRLQPNTRYLADPASVLMWEREAVAEERAREAARRREVERLDFEQARRAGTAGALRAYLSQYGSGANHRDDARSIIAKLDQQRFASTKRVGTLEAYRDYLSEFPDGSSASEARRVIDQFDAEALASARRANTVASYSAYLSRFPNGRGAGEAQSSIMALDRAAYARASRLNRPEAFQGYLQEFASGSYTSNAREWLEVESARRATLQRVAEQRRREQGESGKAFGFGAISLAGFGGGGLLGYQGYQAYKQMDSVRTALNALTAGTPEHDATTKEKDRLTKRTGVLAGSALVAVYIGGTLWNRAGVHRARAAQEKMKRVDLETEAARQLDRMNGLRIVAASAYPVLARGSVVGVGLRMQVAW